MSNSYVPQLKGIVNVGDCLLSEEIETNLKAYFDWTLLKIGNSINVQRSQTTLYSGSPDVLRRVNDPNYTNGQVWETPKQDLIWETGVAYSGNSPTSISGVWVDSTFYGPSDSTYGHHVNHPLGRVVFASAISTSATVQLNYSYRWVQFHIAENAEWWEELQYDAHRADDSNYSVVGSGAWGILSNHRVQLPAVVVEVVPRRRSSGYELGSGSLWVHQDVLFHVLAQSRWERNKLLDIISLQNDSTIWFFDPTDVAENEAYALSPSGTLISGKGMYPSLVGPRSGGGFRSRKCTFTNTIISEVESHNSSLHEGTVRSTLELVFGTN